MIDIYIYIYIYKGTISFLLVLMGDPNHKHAYKEVSTLKNTLVSI